MKWFKHMSDLPRDEGVSRYLDEAGKDRVTAYGFLILVLEAVSSRMAVERGDLICSATYSIPQWGRITYSHPNRVLKYLHMCEVIGWVLVEYEEGMCKVSILKMVQWRDETTRKSGHSPDKVAQKREEQIRTEQRESRGESTLSDCLKAGGARLSPPPGFEITESLQEWAAKNYPSVDIKQSTDKFLRHEFSNPRSNWNAAWQTWIQREAEYRQKQNGSSAKQSYEEQILELGKELEMEKRPDESEAEYCDRVDQVNQRRIEKLEE